MGHDRVFGLEGREPSLEVSSIAFSVQEPFVGDEVIVYGNVTSYSGSLVDAMISFSDGPPGSGNVLCSGNVRFDPSGVTLNCSWTADEVGTHGIYITVNSNGKVSEAYRMVYVFSSEKATLKEVLDIIGLWQVGEASLSQVLDVVNGWAGI